MILGVRYDESQSRNIVMNKHKIEGKVLRKHTTLNNALVFAPIEDFSTDDVWKYLLTRNPNAWGSDNEFLMNLYQDSQEGECPLMVDDTKPSCGNSRFGCWSCTVVAQDKSLRGFIQTAKRNRDKDTMKKLVPLERLRNWLKDNRNDEEYREHKRQNGAIYKVQTKEGLKVGLGPYNFHAKKLILKMLLETQKESGLKLITEDELKYIQEEWNERSGDLSSSVNKVYKEVYGINIFSEKQAMTYSEDELELLKTLCDEEGVSNELVQRLLKVEQKYYGYQYRSGLYRDIEKILDEDWVHEDVITEVKFGDKVDN
jgi:DNA sulfur modification protein DndC